MILLEEANAFSRPRSISKMRKWICHQREVLNSISVRSNEPRLYLEQQDSGCKTSRYLTRYDFLLSAVTVASSPCIANAANLPQSNGADFSRTGTLDTLVPIVQMRQSVLKAKSELSDSKALNLIVPSEQCTFILKQISQSIPREEKQFKRIFDAYSTPVSYKQKFLDQNAFLVYYSKGFDGPGRPNIEDDVENGIQTLQYGFRNEAWTAMDNLFTELEYGSKADDNSVYKDELVDLIGNALKAFDLYLSCAPESDVKSATNVIN